MRELMTPKIEKGVQIPIRGQYRALVNAMKAGESFALPADKVNTVRTAIMAIRRNHKDAKFSVLKYENAYRCWRIK